MNTPTINTITVPAAAGGQPSAFNFSGAGNYFYCQSATTPLQVQFDAGAVTTFKSGQQLQGPFNHITFFNSGSIPVIVSFYVADAPLSYVSDNQTKVGSSYSLGRGLISLGAGAANDYPGTYNGTQRKQIVVHNLDANLSIQILDSGGNIFDVLTAGQDWTFESDADFQVKNPNGSAVNVAIGETFYQS